MAKLGVPSMQLFSVEGAFFGYNGLFQIMRRIDFALTNTNYQKRIAQHIRLPYKDWYWEADTYSFIKE
jgi:nitrogenase molybdenum-iron protein alpha chain